jgi:hypothetical protein
VTWRVPDPWPFVLLTLAAYRLLRFTSWDQITEPARAWVTGRHETGSGKDARDTGKGRKTWAYRPKVDEFLHCPFCAGWWICVVGYVAWTVWPHAVEVLAVPWAASGVVGLISKNWDA